MGVRAQPRCRGQHRAEVGDEAERGGGEGWASARTLPGRKTSKRGPPPFYRGGNLPQGRLLGFTTTPAKTPGKSKAAARSEGVGGGGVGDFGVGDGGVGDGGVDGDGVDSGGVDDGGEGRSGARAAPSLDSRVRAAASPRARPGCPLLPAPPADEPAAEGRVLSLPVPRCRTLCFRLFGFILLLLLRSKRPCSAPDAPSASTRSELRCLRLLSPQSSGLFFSKFTFFSRPLCLDGRYLQWPCRGWCLRGSSSQPQSSLPAPGGWGGRWAELGSCLQGQGHHGTSGVRAAGHRPGVQRADGGLHPHVETLPRESGEGTVFPITARGVGAGCLARWLQHS